MTIDKVFKELDPYLRGMKKAENYCIVEVHLKNSWLIPPHQSIKHQSKKIDNGMVYYMFYGEDNETFDTIIDWLKTEVVEMNIEVEQKESLLKQKVAELKEVFESSSLEELKALKFSSKPDVLKLNGSSKNNTESKKEVEKLEK
ncbi:MAG: hypothetical protein ACXACC_10645 [Promethearchaeota archaeon]|jgi:hypothetical protein